MCPRNILNKAQVFKRVENNYCGQTKNTERLIARLVILNQTSTIHETDFDFTSTRLLINLLLFQLIAQSDLCGRAPFFCSLSSQLRPDTPSKQINISQARCCLRRHDLHSYAIPFLSAEHFLLWREGGLTWKCCAWAQQGYSSDGVQSPLGAERRPAACEDTQAGVRERQRRSCPLPLWFCGTQQKLTKNTEKEKMSKGKVKQLNGCRQVMEKDESFPAEPPSRLPKLSSAELLALSRNLKLRHAAV